jgi:hypothetical protein
MHESIIPRVVSTFTLTWFIRYHWLVTSVCGLLIHESTIRPVVSTSTLTWLTEVTIQWYLINHVSAEVLTTGRMILWGINSPPTEVTTQWYLINHVSVEVMTTGRMILSSSSCQYLYTDMVYNISLGGYFCWCTTNPREYHPSSSQYLYPDMVYKISLGGYFCRWTINPREYHPSSSQWINSPPTEVTTQWYILSHVSVEVLTTGRMILSWINSPPTEVTTQWYLINQFTRVSSVQ